MCVLEMDFGSDLYIWNAWVHLYCRFNDLDKQHNMIEEMPLRAFGFLEYSIIGRKHWKLVSFQNCGCGTIFVHCARALTCL